MPATASLHYRRHRSIKLVLVGTVLALALYMCASQAWAVGGTTYYVAQSGSDSNSCTSQSAACKTINAAYQKASGGDVVVITSDLTASQTINNHSVALASDVTIKPATGVTPSIPGITWCGADNVYMQGPMTMKTLSNYSCLDSLSKDVTLDGLTFDYGFDTSATDGSVVGLYGNADSWTLKNVDIEHGYNVKGFYMSSWTPASTAYYPTNITLENSKIHDWSVDWQKLASTGDYVHTECMFANKVQGLTLRGNHFYNCVSTGNGIIGDAGAESLHPSNYLLENNIFERSWNGPQAANESVGIHSVGIDGFGSQMRGHNVFRYNLFETGMFSNNATALASGTTLEFYGNIGTPPPCSQITASDYNVWISTPSCKGAHDVTDAGVLSTTNFASLATRASSTTIPSSIAAGDWHYKSVSSMIGKGNPGNTCSAFGQLNAGTSPCYPATDKDGNVRSGTPDAGPYQYGATVGGSAQYHAVDLANLTAHYGQSGVAISAGDIDNDGSVTVYDLSRLLADYIP